MRCSPDTRPSSPASYVLRLTVTFACRGNHIITVPQCVGAHSAEHSAVCEVQAAVDTLTHLIASVNGSHGGFSNKRCRPRSQGVQLQGTQVASCTMTMHPATTARPPEPQLHSYCQPLLGAARDRLRSNSSCVPGPMLIGVLLWCVQSVTAV